MATVRCQHSDSTGASRVHLLFVPVLLSEEGEQVRRIAAAATAHFAGRAGVLLHSTESELPNLVPRLTGRTIAATLRDAGPLEISPIAEDELPVEIETPPLFPLAVVGTIRAKLIPGGRLEPLPLLEE